MDFTENFTKINQQFAVKVACRCAPIVTIVYVKDVSNYRKIFFSDKLTAPFKCRDEIRNWNFNYWEIFILF